jgi:hypothetical protein
VEQNRQLNPDPQDHEANERLSKIKEIKEFLAENPQKADLQIHEIIKAQKALNDGQRIRTMDIIVKVVEGNSCSKETDVTVLGTILQAEADGYELIVKYVGENGEV